MSSKSPISKRFLHGILTGALVFMSLNLSAQDLAKCVSQANIVKEVAELKQRGLSRSEIRQNLTEIAKLKKSSEDHLNEWMLGLEWLYQREHVRLGPQGAQETKLDECKRELGVIEWK